jgi:hypothetical protein
MYPKIEERNSRINGIDAQLRTLMLEREQLMNLINQLILEKRILENLNVLQEAEEGRISLGNVQSE